MGTLTVDGYRIESLTMQTWDAFADLAERHNGVWGGCWCTYFHLHPDPKEERRALGHREFKRRLVEAGRAHAALVFDGDVAVAWAQFGTVPELPNIHHRKEWEQGVAQMPDYRITCLFVDRAYRRAHSHEQACSELSRCAGTQFDERVVEAFVAALSTLSPVPAHQDA